MMTEYELYSIEEFTKKKESNLAYNMEQNTDLWLVLISEYTISNGQRSEFLKRGIIDELVEWNDLVRTTSLTHFRDLKDIICNKTTRWRLAIRKMLEDPVHANIFDIYLRSLVALKLKKVNLAFGGEVRQKINRVLSFTANETLIYFRKYMDATKSLQVGKTDLGVLIDGNMRGFYEGMKKENLNFVIVFLTIIIYFKTAQCTEDINFLRQHIQKSLLKPIEMQLTLLNNRSDEHKILKDKLDSYQKLLNATDISFD
jgi:hypothetical protein